MGMWLNITCTQYPIPMTPPVLSLVLLSLSHDPTLVHHVLLSLLVPYLVLPYLVLWTGTQLISLLLFPSCIYIPGCLLYGSPVWPLESTEVLTPPQTPDCPWSTELLEHCSPAPFILCTLRQCTPLTVHRICIFACAHLHTFISALACTLSAPPISTLSTCLGAQVSPCCNTSSK